MTSRLGYVVIGRNEGERLIACLASLRQVAEPIVYVDSGSTDGSVETASTTGAHVVPLDMSTPFTAARGRNAGLSALVAIAPDTDLVQFIDGDCELAPGWSDAARAFLGSRRDVTVVAGRLREKYAGKSLYNRLCDLEWDAPIGESDLCGGIAMMRIGPVLAAGGFNESLIAGEEPELCVRLRERGGRVWRIAEEMALHDAAMTRFSQWWRRVRRGGFAFAEVAELHRHSPKGIWRREAARPLLWAGIAPAALVAAAFFGPPALLALLIYPAKIASGALRLSPRPQLTPLTQSVFQMLAKFAEAEGVAQYWFSRLFGRRTSIIEYKASES